ncbi:MAG: TIGR02221 family CRISPR-associated protein [Ignavibacterium sp.]|nr:TIGR02221 family CRISPR-associated protein [Ignavibacterium sp.]MDW8376455.1 TIGR02221 family CRISPR-associated protein [Ignavibacteriales bacterium]
MKKAFISILGTNNYLECRHSFGDIITDVPVKYCQEDIIKIFCEDFDEESEIRIFITDEAEKKNWLDNGHIDKIKNSPIENKGLKQRLESLNLKSQIKPIKIKEGFDENEIWDLFQVIFDSFREEEEVIVDITHSFRSLPMLMITLLNYAKQVKKIKVSGIYYAAFETLGSIPEVEKIPANERIAPILNLTSFSYLQDWTNATFDFINNGSIKSLKNLSKMFNEKNETTKFRKNLLGEIDNVLDNMALCRGGNLLDYDFNTLKQKIRELKTSNNFTAFNTLIDKISDKFEVFDKSGIKNLLETVKWCYEHKLYQQSITLLLETMITTILIKLGLDEKERKNRQVVTNVFNIKSKNIPKSDWNELCNKHSDLTEKILSLSFVDIIIKEYEYLSDIRNDINHGGFNNDSKKSNSIISRLRNSIDNIIPKIQSFLNE